MSVCLSVWHLLFCTILTLAFDSTGLGTWTQSSPLPPWCSLWRECLAMVPPGWRLLPVYIIYKTSDLICRCCHIYSMLL